MKISSRVSALAILCASSLAAQGIGSKAPPIVLEGFSQTPAKSFDDYSGRAVMFEFFAYWCGPCASSVPHVNDIQREWGPKGLSVIGVTDETPSVTEPWISANKATYAYAYDKGGKLQNYFGVDSIPRAVVIDASGTVLFNGHPSELDDGVLAKAVTGALAKPMWEWTGAAKAVKTAVQKGDFKTALDAATALGAADGGADVLAAVQGMVKSKIAGLRTAMEKGDYLGAQAAATSLQKSLAGLPEGAEAAKIATDIAADPKAAEVIKGQQRLAKIVAKEPNKKKEWLAAIEDLQKLQKDYPEGFVASEAKRLIGEYRDLAGR